MRGDSDACVVLFEARWSKSEDSHEPRRCREADDGNQDGKENSIKGSAFNHSVSGGHGPTYDQESKVLGESVGPRVNSQAALPKQGILCTVLESSIASGISNNPVPEAPIGKATADIVPETPRRRITHCVSEGPTRRSTFRASTAFRENLATWSSHVSQADWMSASGGYWETSSALVGGGVGGESDDDEEEEEEVDSRSAWTRGRRATGKPRQGKPRKSSKSLIVNAVVQEGRERPSESSSAVSGWDMYSPRGRSSLGSLGARKSAPRIRQDRRKWVYSPDDMAEDERIDRIRSVTRGNGFNSWPVQLC
ncbi:hypothetical protein CLOM_g178 [Closterium sp. NIES-68]|nr:hypothetical protein CLOM_g178 [Closterium sp. NIES-68]GJP68071.1 hypothetical protein CLOP_g24822 [Closterium sp. NIES-67]GJP85869.1 hypothetical protein CLOP_g15961 [Closterium sp. NIES-67]